MQRNYLNNKEHTNDVSWIITPDAERLPSGVPGVFCCCCCFSFLDRHHNCSCFVPVFSIWSVDNLFQILSSGYVHFHQPS